MSPSSSILLPNIPVAQAIFVMGLGPGFGQVMERPECRVYAYGKIMYKDNTLHPHWRHFCSFWFKGTANGFVDCDSYSDGDEDYPDGKEPNYLL